MMTRLHYGLHDERLVQDLQRLLGLPRGSLHVRSFDDLKQMRHVLGEHGWLMEIRECSPETFTRDGGGTAARILVAKERALLIARSGRKLSVSVPTGARVALAPEEAFALFDSETTTATRSRRERWRRHGVDSRTIARSEHNLGPHRSSVLAAWFDDGNGGRAAAALELAARQPSLVPLNLEHASSQDAPWLEIRLSRMARLSERRSPWLSVLGMIAQEKGLLASIVALAVLAAPLGFAMAMTAAFIMDYSPLALKTPWSTFGLILAIFLINKSLGLVQQYAGVRLGGRLSWRLTRSFVMRVLNARIDAVRRLGDGDLYTRLNDLTTIQSVLMGQVLSLLFGAATMIGGMIYLFKIAPFVILPTILGGLIVAALLIWYVPQLRALRWDQLTTTSAYRDRVLERMEGRRAFKHTDAMGLLFHRIDPLLTRVAEYSQQGTVLAARLAAGASLVGILHIGVITWLAANRYQGGAASLGSLTVIVGFSVAALQSLIQLMSLVPAVVAAEPSVSRVQEVIRATHPEPPSQGIPPRKTVAADVEVEDLYFCWEKGLPVLQGTSFRMPAGSWTCLVGPSGCGKSTLAGILGGLLQAERGTITLDGMPYRDYAPSVFRSRIALVTQESFLFNLTIRENITLGRTGCSAEKVLEVLCTTGLTEFVARQPRGLEQLVGENGTRMSLGEKCRLSLARALLRGPGLVILDESLARLDARTREKVEQGLRARGLTVLILTHDLSQASRCDQVLVMSEGKITESGTFDELTQRRGAFAGCHATRRPVAVEL